MDKYKKFEILCKEKILKILKDIKEREVVIWGASKGGEIAKKVLENIYGIKISNFIDKDYEKKKAFLDLTVSPIDSIDVSKNYVVVAIMSFVYEIDEKMIEMGFNYLDYIYIYDNEGYNKEDIVYKGCNIGRYTYGYESLLEFYPFAKKIGRYCSINHTARIWNNHPLDYVTTHPFLDYKMFYSYEKQNIRKAYCEKYGKYFNNAEYENSFLRSNEPVIIGNDVWIGANVIILPGVVIGDGAVIAAGSVVTKNIDPYAIVGGVPARTLRKRFCDVEIEKMLSIKWWNWSVDKIEENIELFYQPDKFLKIMDNNDCDLDSI